LSAKKGGRDITALASFKEMTTSSIIETFMGGPMARVMIGGSEESHKWGMTLMYVH